MKTVLGWLKKNIVLCVATLAALVTVFIVPPDSEYLRYEDWKTLACLFCVLAVVCAFKNINFFFILACRIVLLFRNTRRCILALVYITFIGSMLIANDMALLTFLPLGLLVLNATNLQRLMAFTFIMQNIAANLGGMLTPFGNPQNLYLYSYFNIPTGEFMLIMLPTFLLSVAMITACVFVFVKPEPMLLAEAPVTLNGPRAIIYGVLFVLSIALVFGIIPYYIGLVIVFIAILCLDRKALLMVDYPLLATFFVFFIFSGNMARIEAVSAFFDFLLSKSTLVFSALSCQVISNVPSAILLSKFTANYADLLVGVNIGGCGTLISSLASLITFREFTKNNPGKAASYIGKFSAFNFAFLIILIMFQLGLNAII